MWKHAAILTSLAAGSALAQQGSNVSPAHKHAWGENIGWMNWRDADGGAAGAVIGETFLSGYVWCENVGWLNLGDGTPADGVAYANTDGADFGVNISSGGDLEGLAWGENIGWVNFDTWPQLGDFGQQARIDRDAGRLRGFAWGENIGWVNLDDDEHFVGFLCPADFNGDGVVDTRDVLAFLNTWTSGGSGADFNGDGAVDTRDVLAFLNAWTTGC